MESDFPPMKTFSERWRGLQRLAAGIAAVASIGATVPAVQAQQPGLAVSATPVVTAREPLLNRIVLIGASVTAGFSITEPFGGPSTPQYRLRHYVEAALNVPHEPVVTHANAFFFTKPVEILEGQLKSAQEARPTVVVALDSLFWFCYGNLPSEQARLERFETGLRLLEKITVPVVLGDIPDASGAVGKILEKKQMPELATIAKCNERLMAWAGERENIRIFPLAKLMAAASTNDELKLETSTWSKGESRALLQKDGLHPSTSGLAALTIEVMSITAALAQPTLPETAVEQNLTTVLAAASVRAKAEADQRAQERRAAEKAAGGSGGQGAAAQDAAIPSVAP